MMALSARRTLVTGASQPLGIALVRECLRRGDRVYAAARSPARVPELADLRAEFGGLELLPLDPADAASVADAMCVLEQLTSSLDRVVISPAEPGAHVRVGDVAREEDFATLSGTAVVDHLRRHAVAPVLLLRTLLPLLTESEQARILVVGSWRGALSQKNAGGHYASDTSAAALNMLMRTLANDLRAERILLCIAGPGLHTAMTPQYLDGEWEGHVADEPTAEDEPAADDYSLDDIAQGMLAVTERMPPDKTGCFHDWTGVERPW